MKRSASSALKSLANENKANKKHATGRRATGETMRCVTCTGPVNIAVIKYWGKRDEDLILPVNSSLSVTLSQDQLRAKTTVAASKEFIQDRIWLNGREESMKSARLQNVMREIRRRANKHKLGDGDVDEEDLERAHIHDMVNWKIHVCSENNFPTAAGLASSAAGYACLVYSLARLFKVEGEISDIARQGSGSACRSIYGGFVEWEMGRMESGFDSIALQVAPASHWPELRVLILVVSDQKKHTSSTAGMQTSVQTSDLLKHRVCEVVPKRMIDMKAAIQCRDFQHFAEITMKDSNQFHAVCLDTFPPISYMTDMSRQIVRMLHLFNSHCKETKVCYTFDAGPNACLYLLEKDVPRVLSLVNHFFPGNSADFIRGLPVDVPSITQDDIDAIGMDVQTEAIKYVIHTKAGPGPQVMQDADDSLLDDNGMPKRLVTGL